MGSHVVNGQFQSDKYPTCPPGKVPLSVRDPTAQDLLWAYAQRRRAVDAEFSADLEACLRQAGHQPDDDELAAEREETQELLDQVGVFDCCTGDAPVPSFPAEPNSPHRASSRAIIGVNRVEGKLLAIIRTLCEAMIEEGMGES